MTFVVRPPKTVGVWSARLSKTLIVPLFSATNTLPSPANRIAVGLTRLDQTTVSWKPAGTAPAVATWAVWGQLGSAVSAERAMKAAGHCTEAACPAVGGSAAATDRVAIGGRSGPPAATSAESASAVRAGDRRRPMAENTPAR